MKHIKQKLSKIFQLLKADDGQAMVEFAVVLPILLLLTVGTLLLTVSFIQKSRMNALAFMSARVGVVRRTDFQAADQTLKLYQERSKQAWVNQINIKEQTVENNHVVIRLAKPGERLDIFANLISGRPSSGDPASLEVSISQPIEYPETGSLRPKTISEVDYQYSNRSNVLNIIGLIPNSLLDDRQMADPMSGGDDLKDELLGLKPPDKNLKWFYDDLDWKILSSNQESASGEFADLQDNYKLLDEIQKGGSTMKFIFAKLFPMADKILGVVMVGVENFEKSATKAADTLDQNVRDSFQSDAGTSGS